MDKENLPHENSDYQRGQFLSENPFHRGHAWQIAEIRRRLGADTAVAACMSGNFVQRGDFAILSTRAVPI